MATLSDLKARNSLPPGTIKAFAGGTIPTGWVACNGAAISRTTFPGLFTAISTTYGVGNGSTTFNVPDLQGRSPMGDGSGSGLTARTAGTKTGAESTALLEINVPTHTHTLVHTHTASQSTSTSSDGAHTHSVSQSQLVQAPVGTSGYTSGGSGFNNAGSVSVLSGSSAHAHAFSVSMTSSGASATTTSNGSGSGGTFGILSPVAVVKFIIKT